MIDPVTLVQKEDLIRWCYEPVNDFHRKYLWFPQFKPLSNLGLYLLFHN